MHHHVLDFFSGSGTTGQSVIEQNREDGGNRKYIMVEMGQYFDSVLKPRIQKVVYSRDWEDGKPISRVGSSHMFKYVRLEQYEDVLNNLQLQSNPVQRSILDRSDDLKESYYLHYMLDIESRNGGSLLNVASFENPFDYKLKLSGDEITTADLVETFNYLLGLTVRQVRVMDGYKTVRGTLPNGEGVLVIWRNLHEISNDDLTSFVRAQGYLATNAGLDRIYVNGDHNLETQHSACKVLPTEEAFLRLMFGSPVA